MVKLDVSLLRFMEAEDFRVLTALEMAMRNHDVAPTALVERIAQLPHGGCRKRLNTLLRHKMIHHENTMYDGFAMKYGAYDYLALRTLSKRGSVTGVGHRIGCGKESDIVLVQDDVGHECVLKLQRLGRCSFRTVTRNRDYKNGRTRHGESWFYLSRLASQKEYGFMKVLYDEGFPVPKPIDQNRHALVMELVNGTLLNNIQILGDAEKVYRRCLDLMVKLAEAGLIHGDFNEFNLMITDDLRVIMIDFPQMVSTNHHNASELFSRDVENLAAFFHRRFKVDTLLFPTLESDVVRTGNLDKQVYASGHFSRKLEEDLQALMESGFGHTKPGADGADGDDDVHSSEDDSDEEDEDVAEDDLDRAGTGVVFAVPTGGETGEAHKPRGAEKAGNEDGNEDGEDEEGDIEESEEDEESEAGSLDEGMTDAREARHAARELRRAENANFTNRGEINEDHLRQQVRRGIRSRDNHDFNRGLHRNVQKGRQKRKIRTQLKSASAMDFWD